MPKWRPRVILWNCIKELLPPGSQQLPAKSEGFPTALGIDSVFWISARRAGITCAKKTYFFVTEQVLTWLQSPPSWQKTNPRGKRRKSNLVPHSWAECSAVSTRNETRAGRTRGEQSWKQDQGKQDCPPGTSQQAQLSHQTASTIPVAKHTGDQQEKVSVSLQIIQMMCTKAQS